MVLVSTYKSNGNLFRAQTIIREIDKLKISIEEDAKEELEFEILTEEEYEARNVLEPVGPRLPSTEERLQMAEETLMYLLMGGM